MTRKLTVGFLLVFISCSLFEYLEHAVALARIYASIQHLMLPEEETRTGIVILSYAIFAFFFTLIFSHGYKGTGIMEGVRYGVYIAFLTSFTYAYLAYATTPIPHSLALWRTLIGIVQNVVYGVILVFVFGKTGAKAVPEREGTEKEDDTGKDKHRGTENTEFHRGKI